MQEPNQLTATRASYNIDFALTCIVMETYSVPPCDTHQGLPEWQLHGGSSVAKGGPLTVP